MKLFCVLAAVTAQAVSAATIETRTSNFVWGETKIRGVNIGGWLVLEPWITPSIFENVDPANNIVDEYTLCEKLGREACCSILHQHWSTWTSQADFAKIAAAGINVVRIPIGFWAFSNADSPYCTGAKAYLDKALEWARQTGLKVMIDLHGAPGSQNGFDNSGKRGNVGWLVDGGVGGYTAQYTVTVIQNMAGWYAGPQWDDVVIGIELLNEPFSPKLSMEDLKAFTKEGYRRVRKHSSTRTVIFQDGFMHPAYYNGFLTPWDDNSQLVSIDHHYYHMFDAGLIRMSPAQHLEQVCNAVPSYTGADKWTFIGEWSAGMTDCAKWLNGYLRGARYDGSFPDSQWVGDCGPKNDMKQWDVNMVQNTKDFITAQLNAFEKNTQGWVFWNFKTENSHAPEWDFFALLDAGIFPRDLSSRPLAGRCV